MPDLLRFFFFNDTATTEIYTLSLHDALPIHARGPGAVGAPAPGAAGAVGAARAAAPLVARDDDRRGTAPRGRGTGRGHAGRRGVGRGRTDTTTQGGESVSSTKDVLDRKSTR